MYTYFNLKSKNLSQNTSYLIKVNINSKTTLRSSKEKTKDASKEFTSKKVPTSSSYVKSKPLMGSKVKLTSCKPLQQEKMYQDDKSFTENRIAEGLILN